MTFKGHSEEVASVAISPDGKLVASASKDKFLKLWELKTGQLISTIPHQQTVNTVAFSLDGKMVATGCDDQMIRLFPVV